MFRHKSLAEDAETRLARPRKRSHAGSRCFRCSKNGIRCDQKKPYCSQCLWSNVICPGYKTSLTWVDGIASRGNSRGIRGTPQDLAEHFSANQNAGAKAIHDHSKCHSVDQLPASNPCVSSNNNSNEDPSHGISTPILERQSPDDNRSLLVDYAHQVIGWPSYDCCVNLQQPSITIVPAPLDIWALRAQNTSKIPTIATGQALDINVQYQTNCLSGLGCL